MQSLYQARSSRRFPISMSLQYHLTSSNKASAKGGGRGMTINLSSSGVLFESPQILPLGRRLDLFLDWPVRRHDQVDMVLFILGRIVRRSGTSVGVEILKYEFRSRPSPSQHLSLPSDRLLLTTPGGTGLPRHPASRNKASMIWRIGPPEPEHKSTISTASPEPRTVEILYAHCRASSGQTRYAAVRYAVSASRRSRGNHC
jgi:hypothetical protein